jgi:hypothetical protein
MPGRPVSPLVNPMLNPLVSHLVNPLPADIQAPDFAFRAP